MNDTKEERTAYGRNIFRKPLKWGRAFGIGGAKLNQLESLKLKTGERVLDEGCGMGFVIGNINAKERYGIDIEPSHISQARARYPEVNFSVRSVEDTGFQDGFFDLILCLDVIEHTEDDVKVVREAYRILKPQGSLVLSTPVKGSNILPFSRKITENLHRMWGHVRLYSMDELTKLLEMNGFIVVNTRTHVYIITKVLSYLYGVVGRWAVKKSTAQNLSSYGSIVEKFMMWTDKLERLLKLGTPFQMFIVAVKKTQ